MFRMIFIVKGKGNYKVDNICTSEINLHHGELAPHVRAEKKKQENVHLFSSAEFFDVV